MDAQTAAAEFSRAVDAQNWDEARRLFNVALQMRGSENNYEQYRPGSWRSLATFMANTFSSFNITPYPDNRTNDELLMARLAGLQQRWRTEENSWAMNLEVQRGLYRLLSEAGSGETWSAIFAFIDHVNDYIRRRGEYEAEGGIPSPQPAEANSYHGGGSSGRNDQLRLAMSAPLADRVRSAAGMKTELDQLIGHLEKGQRVQAGCGCGKQRVRAAGEPQVPVQPLIESYRQFATAALARFGGRAAGLVDEFMAWAETEVPWLFARWDGVGAATPEGVRKTVTDLLARFMLGVSLGDPDGADEATQQGGKFLATATHELYNELENNPQIVGAVQSAAMVAGNAGDNAAFVNANLVKTEDGLWNIIEGFLVKAVAITGNLDAAMQMVRQQVPQIAYQMYEAVRTDQRGWGLWTEGRYQDLWGFCLSAAQDALRAAGIGPLDSSYGSLLQQVRRATESAARAAKDSGGNAESAAKEAAQREAQAAAGQRG